MRQKVFALFPRAHAALPAMNSASGAHPNAPQGLQTLLGNPQQGREPDALQRHLLALQQQQEAAQQYFLDLQQFAQQRRHSVLAAAAEGAGGDGANRAAAAAERQKLLASFLTPKCRPRAPRRRMQKCKDAGSCYIRKVHRC